MRAWIFFSALTFGACGRVDIVLLPAADGGGVELPPIEGLASLRLDPPRASLVDPGAPPHASQTFRVFGTFVDRVGEEDVSARVNYSLSDPELGNILAGNFESRGIAGKTTLIARSGTISMGAEIEVSLEVVAFAPGVTPDSAQLFPADPAAGATGAGAPVIIYPASTVVLPRNMRGVRYQWTAAGGQDVFELRFASSVATVRYYTRDTSYLTGEAAWRWLQASHGDRSMTLTVRGLSSQNPGQVSRSSPVTVQVARAEIPGAAYFWSTSGPGIMRATIDTPLPVRVAPEGTTADVHCVACHALSRDGRRMALANGEERLRLWSVPDRRETTPAVERGYAFGSFDPSGDHLVVARHGQLAVLDAATGQPLANIPVPVGTYATHPDWSPDGGWITVALLHEVEDERDLKEGTGLARIRVNAINSYGAAQILVPSREEHDLLYFPAYSPDGRWIAYVRGGEHSRYDRGTQLYLIRADGSGSPILLEHAGRVVGPESGRSDLGNKMPTWALSTESHRAWLVFSSIREYGAVLPAGGRAQLWVSGIDLDRAVNGQDPSAPALWLPFQAGTAGNHRALWSPEATAGCTPSRELCDGRDNDCDREVDEECCSPVTEVCDSQDNDCDGVTDEGCRCAAAESCANGTDDDCNGLTDSKDPICHG